MSKKTMKDYIKGVTPLNIKNAITHFRKEKVTYEKNEQICKSDVKYLSSFKFDAHKKTRENNQLGILNRKSKRKFLVERVVDLHGLTVSQALITLVELFAQFQSENIRNILVITGGSSMRISKIRLYFELWINNELSQYAASFSQAKPGHGGEGAFYIILRKS